MSVQTSLPSSDLQHTGVNEKTLQVLATIEAPTVEQAKFSTPEHPSHKFLEQLKSRVSTNDVLNDPPPYNSRDPHEKPEFTTSSVIQPTEPVLYLPPLISKLPPTLKDIPAPEDYPPMYTDTRLPDIDPVSLSLHKALHFFKPLSDKYASTPYANAFNWADLDLPVDEEREWYVVAFRSTRKEGSDGSPLYEADRLAHEEAVENGGLLMYWYGVPDVTGLNLATCIWQSRRHAVAAMYKPNHINAMKLSAASFEKYVLERYRLRKSKGQTHVTVESYEGGEVGW